VRKEISNVKQDPDLMLLRIMNRQRLSITRGTPLDRAMADYNQAIQPNSSSI